MSEIGSGGRRDIAIRPEGAVSQVADEMSRDQVLAQVEKIQLLIAKAMKRDEHYGVIPGTNKPTLLKPGAEKLCLLFRLAPDYRVQKTWDGPHLSVDSTCTLTHIPTSAHMGSGMGSCSTRESKYAYRKGERLCPQCHKPAIIKGQAQYGGGWLCWKKKEGCGAKFADGDQSIEGQETGRMDNPDLPDQYNTVLKMSNKRALIAAVLNVTAASDFFSQDVEDIASAREELREPAEPTVKQLEAVSGPVVYRKEDRREGIHTSSDLEEFDPVVSDEERKGLLKLARDEMGHKEGTAWVLKRMEELGITRATMGPYHLNMMRHEIEDYKKAGDEILETFEGSQKIEEKDIEF